MVQFVVFKGC